MTNETLLFQYFTGAMIDALSRLRLQPDATPVYEGLSGGLIWSDEWSEELTRACRSAPPEKRQNVRYLWAHRADLIRGLDPPRFSELWLVIQDHIPNWPGLHPSRRSHELRGQLEAMEEAFFADLASGEVL